MCGIAGAVGIEDRSVVEAMTAALHHRGPDERGYWWQPNVGLGATRLSIVDLAAGAQPITNEDRTLALVFNGEIYNHHELRRDLQRRGHRFATETDGEVIVHLYEEHGARCVDHLRGMFAFAIAERDTLFLARDRLGIKPLHYTFLPEHDLLLFASEIKALLQCPLVTPRLDLQTFADALVIGYPVGSGTYFQGIRSLPPGHTLTVALDDGVRMGEPQAYFTPCETRNEDVDPRLARDTFVATLCDALERHLAADVPVGLTLSGGVDSSLLALLTHELGYRPLVTFTIADDARHPDIEQASAIARMIGSEHTPIVLSFADYLANIPLCAASEEQPSSLFGVPYFAICGTIAQRFKACIHGEGADELFGGYREYLDQEFRLAFIRRRLPLLKSLGVAPSERAIHMIQALSSPTTMNEYVERILRINLRDQLERYHLNPVDKGAMAYGLEMRVPFLDDRVVEWVTALPAWLLVRSDLGIRKYLLRRLCVERFGAGLLDVVLREKIGVPAAGMRLLDRFDQMCEQALPTDYLERHDLGFCFDSKRKLLMFELFLSIFMEHRGSSDAVGSITDFIGERAAHAVPA